MNKNAIAASTTVAVRVPNKYIAVLEKEAARRGERPATILREAVREWVEKREQNSG